MGKLFQFEDEVPMRFFIVSGSAGNLPTTIETLGGEMISPFHAHFALIDDVKEVTEEMRYLPAQLVNIRWVQQSKSAGRIRPIYPYLRESSPGSHKDGLAGLGDSARDVAELVKAVTDLNGAVPDREMYEILHRKYPHQTSQQWESLYKSNTSKITTAVAVVKADLEKKLDDCITFLLCGQMEEGEEGTLMLDEDDTLFTREDDMEIEEDEVPTGDAIPNSTDDHDLTSLSGSSADGEADTDDEFPGPIPILKPKRSRGREHGRGSGNIRGSQPLKYTEAELDLMAAFLMEQELTHKIAGLNYWKLFCQQDVSRNNRKPYAWRAYYGRHRAELNARALALSKDGNRQQPEHQEEAVNVSGGNDTSTITTRHHQDLEQPLPSGWEMFRSERYKGTPFYHHAASSTSFWKLSEVFKFSESRREADS